MKPLRRDSPTEAFYLILVYVSIYATAVLSPPSPDNRKRLRVGYLASLPGPGAVGARFCDGGVGFGLMEAAAAGEGIGTRD